MFTPVAMSHSHPDTRMPNAAFAPLPQPVVMSQQLADGHGKTVCVVGAGIMGMTCAYRLAENGFDVAVVTRETVHSALAKASAPDIPYTSAGSGGLWWPFHIEPEAKIPIWGEKTLQTLRQHKSRDVGVSEYEGFILHATRTPTTLPWFSHLTNMSIVTPDQDPRVPSRYASAYRFTSVLVEMERYLEFLHYELEVTMRVPIFTDLSRTTAPPNPTADATSAWSLSAVSAFAHDVLGTSLLVNCTGVSARTFAADQSVVPGRGVVLLARRRTSHAAFDYFVTEDDADGFESRDSALAYAFPRGPDRLTLGGSIGAEDDFRLRATGSEAEGIRSRVARLVPCLGDVELAEADRWAGLRPLRHGGVRLEVERKKDVTVIHNYGHGGGGVTTCWGCADEVVELALAEWLQ